MTHTEIRMTLSVRTRRSGAHHFWAALALLNVHLFFQPATATATRTLVRTWGSLDWPNGQSLEPEEPAKNLGLTL